VKSPWISALRSVALTVPDLASAEVFYTQVWQLVVAARTTDTVYFRGSGSDHHVLSLQQVEGTPQILKVTLRARSMEALPAIAAATLAAGGTIEKTIAPASDPAAGTALIIKDADGRRFEIVFGDLRRDDSSASAPDQPIRLAHAVLNSHAVTHTQVFMEQALRFTLADRTRIMAFMNCDADHHTIALGDTDNDALNHIAFLMPTLDAVMRGGGRMKDAGHDIHWGPGRHGPGDNAFNYFIDPFGIVIEYTAEVEQIDDSYQTGQPADWTWPPGRIDQWGIAIAPTPRLREAQRAVLFSSTF
jgi:catechol 2,3-dioxygenase